MICVGGTPLEKEGESDNTDKNKFTERMIKRGNSRGAFSFSFRDDHVTIRVDSINYVMTFVEIKGKHSINTEI